jgi:TolB protein
MLFQFKQLLYKILKPTRCIAITLWILSCNAYAISNIEIIGSNKESLPLEIKIDEFDNTDNLNMLHQIIQRVKLQLNESLIFKVSLEEDNNKFISKLLNKTPEFFPYNLNFSISENPNTSGFKIQIKILDNYLNEISDEFLIEGNKTKWYKAAAQISDRVFFSFTGVFGYFDTSIIFIAESGKFNDRKKKIAIMSLYGDEYEEFTDGKNLVLSPTISSDRKLIAYVSYLSKKPKTYIYNFNSKTLKTASENKKDIMTLTPAFLPGNNNQILMSKVFDGNSEIVKYDLAKNKSIRLTNNPATDISPSYSPVQDRIVFSSDRSGKAELYIMNPEGTEVKKIKFLKGTYTNPKFSPDGRYISFTRFLDDMFSVGILDTETFYTKILSTSYKNDSPSWAPNSKYLIFTKSNENSKSSKHNLSNLYIVDLNGNIINKVRTPADASEAYWFKN